MLSTPATPTPRASRPTPRWEPHRGPVYSGPSWSVDPDKLERLGRYEVHLDRRLERMLAMLLRLKDLRQGTSAG